MVSNLMTACVTARMTAVTAYLLGVVEGGDVVVEGEGGPGLGRDHRHPQLLHLGPGDRVPDVAQALAEHALLARLRQLV